MRYADGLSSWCSACHKEFNRQWYMENKDRHNESSVNWAKNNPKRLREIRKAFHDRNKDARLTYNKEWSKKNKPLRAATTAKRKAAKIIAIPKWADLEKIKEFYAQCPTGFQVDHIVPLISPFVCGLHCESNLQYLSPFENQSKKNYWWPHMPEQAYAQPDFFVKVSHGDTPKQESFL